jgi:alkylation response protein AidB-like acyl-CoA dehydrogenase
MDLKYTQEEEAFRAEVRAFFEAELPADIRTGMQLGKRLRKDDMMRWQKILHRHGWGAVMWPRRFGGAEWSVVQQHIFEEERADIGAPPQNAFSLRMLAQVLMNFANAAQQEYFLPRIIAGEDWWCQGYSEPGSGSDLASLKMKAERDGDHYVLNGQKVWNTLGQFADWIFCLVRTDPAAKPQKGISFLLIDMKSAGITVRPTRLLDGTFEVNEIWFDNVRVPVANRVGEENLGWTYAKFLLGHERTNIAGIGASQRELRRLKQMAAAQASAGSSMLQDPVFGTRIAQVEIELRALEITNMRVIFAEAKQQAPGPEASLLKIRGTEIMQRISELQVDLVGADALAYTDNDGHPARVTSEYLNLRKLSIFGGSNEIQRNIIAHMILGL